MFIQIIRNPNQSLFKVSIPAITAPAATRDILNRFQFVNGTLFIKKDTMNVVIREHLLKVRKIGILMYFIEYSANTTWKKLMKLTLKPIATLVDTSLKEEIRKP